MTGNPPALRPGAGTVAALLLLCILIRLPFWFPSIIDWDESTFILMGQELLDGRLPYVELWDNKPPLAFAAFTVFIALHPSIVAVRVAGALCVFLTSLLTYSVARRIGNATAAALAAALAIVFVSSAGAGQATMTETVALVPLLAATAMLVARPREPRSWLLIGLFLSVAALIRLNLVYVAFAVTAIPLLQWVRHREATGLRALLAYVGGGLLPVALLGAVYGLAGQLDLLWQSAVVAPRLYATSRHGPLEAAAFQVLNEVRPRNVLLWGGFLWGGFLVARDWAKLPVGDRRTWTTLLLVGLATGLSIIMSGASHPHYLIQINPFLAIVAGLGLGSAWSGRRRLIVVPVLLVGLLWPLAPVARQYVMSVDSLRDTGTLLSDEGYRLADFLRTHNVERRPVYLMTHHIAYWLTGTRPPTRLTTHPSNIAKENLFRAVVGPSETAASQMRAVFEREPLFVVKAREPWYLVRRPEALAVLERALGSDYEVVSEINGMIIYKRSSEGASPRSGARRQIP